ncbi:MAG TPA: hypothetical protein VGZ73_08815 [Bryobacteraceae bacterium]|nr:hypothetical protein [Bryobacteraceae bacterium]
MSRCQPRNEAGAIRDFLKWSRDSSRLTAEDYQTTDRLLNRFESSIGAELALLSGTLTAIRREPSIEVFALSEPMLAAAVGLALVDLPLQPFDQSILAAVLVRARELWDAGARELCFCELDRDLQPWDKDRNRKLPLADLYDQARVWVYGNFELTKPLRPPGWPVNPATGAPSI